MDSVNYLRGLLRSWWLILLVVVAGGVGGFLVYHRQTPQYQSSIRLVVASTSGRGTDPSTAQALAGSEAESLSQFVATPPGISDAVKQAGYANVVPNVTAGANATQPFVDINVTSPDPVLATKVAQAYATTAERTKARLSRSSGNYTATALAPASVPGDPVSPNRKQDVGLGLAVGLVLGLALVVLRESLNRTVRDSDELAELLGLTVLGTVPRDMPKTLLPARSHPRSSRAEAYRQVRTSVQSASDVRPMTIAITSATLGEGKTSVATNLAAVFSRAGHRVALVDADLRRPRVADFFELDGDVGLCEVLSGEISLDDALVLQDEGRFAVLPSGKIPANPSEALGGATMAAVLEQLAADFEFVIVDTPPVLPVTDALVLAPHMDGVVMVARLGHTTRERVTRAKSIIDRVDAKVLGVVPNQAGRGTDSDYRYPYRYSEKRGHGDDAATTIPTTARFDVSPDHHPSRFDIARTTSPAVVDAATSVVSEPAQLNGAAPPAPAAFAPAALTLPGERELPFDEQSEPDEIPPIWHSADDAPSDDARSGSVEMNSGAIHDTDHDEVAFVAPPSGATAPAHAAGEIDDASATEPAVTGGSHRGNNARARSRASRRQRSRHNQQRGSSAPIDQPDAAAAPPLDTAAPPPADDDAAAAETANEAAAETPEQGVGYQSTDLLFPEESGWPGAARSNTDAH